MKIKHLLALLSFFPLIISCSNEKVIIVTSQESSNRILYGVDKLKSTLEAENYEVVVATFGENDKGRDYTIYVEESSVDTLAKEGYSISTEDKFIRITGNDASGFLLSGL